jgi:Spy/CpxP family protein refolding chaperone
MNRAKIGRSVAVLATMARLLAAAVGTASARRDGPRRDPGHGAHPGRPHPHGAELSPLERLERRLGELDLATATRTEISVLLDEARSEAREIRGRLEKSQSELLSLLAQDTPDEEAVLARADEVGTLMTTLRKSQLSTWLQVRAKLTPEQRARLTPDKGGRERECEQHR